MQVLQTVVEEEIKKKCVYGERCLGGSECLEWLPCGVARRTLNIFITMLVEDRVIAEVIFHYGVHVHFINRNNFAQQVLFSALVRDGNIMYCEREIDLSSFKVGPEGVWSRTPVYEIYC